MIQKKDLHNKKLFHAISNNDYDTGRFKQTFELKN